VDRDGGRGAGGVRRLLPASAVARPSQGDDSVSIVPLGEELDSAASVAAAEPTALVARPGMNRPASGRGANGVRVSPLQSRHVLVRATLVSADLLALMLAFAVTEA